VSGGSGSSRVVPVVMAQLGDRRASSAHANWRGRCRRPWRDARTRRSTATPERRDRHPDSHARSGEARLPAAMETLSDRSRPRGCWPLCRPRCCRRMLTPIQRILGHTTLDMVKRYVASPTSTSSPAIETPHRRIGSRAGGGRGPRLGSTVEPKQRSHATCRRRSPNRLTSVKSVPFQFRVGLKDGRRDFVA